MKEIVSQQLRCFLTSIEIRLALSQPGTRNAIGKLIQKAGKFKK